MNHYEAQLSRLAFARLYGILDSGYITIEQAAPICAALLDGGADVIQLRVKGVASAEREAWLQAVLPQFAHTDVPLIINDDLELACRYEGLGLHVGQDDTPPEVCREALGPERILGLSTHSLQQATDAIAKENTLNYFAVGPIYATGTKPDYTPVGLTLVSDVAALKPPLPWFCIGGINARRGPEVHRQGARAVVAVSHLLLAKDTSQATRELRSMLMA